VSILLIAISALGGCGVSKTPSASDIKSQLQEALKVCKPVQLTNVEKINGFDLGNGLYRVTTKLTFVTTPISEAGKIVEADEARRAALKAEIERLEAPNNARVEELKQEISTSKIQCDQRLDELEKQARANARPIVERLTAGGKRDVRQEPEIVALQEAYDKERGGISQQCSDASDKRYSEMRSIQLKFQEMKIEYGRLDFSKDAMIGASSFSTTKKIQDALLKECEFHAGGILGEIFHGVYKTYRPMFEKTEVEFSGEIPMMKSDNGWVISGLRR